MNEQVTLLLDNLHHPLRKEIDELRTLILASGNGIVENIKWNGPNYSVKGEDRITIRVNPPPAFNLILHKGARAQKELDEKIRNDGGILTWKSNDRAVVPFKDQASFGAAKKHLPKIISEWLANTIK